MPSLRPQSLEYLWQLWVLCALNLVAEVAEAVYVTHDACIDIQACNRHSLLCWEKADPVPKVDLVPPHERPAGSHTSNICIYITWCDNLKAQWGLSGYPPPVSGLVEVGPELLLDPGETIVQLVHLHIVE